MVCFVWKIVMVFLRKWYLILILNKEKEVVRRKRGKNFLGNSNDKCKEFEKIWFFGGIERKLVCGLQWMRGGLVEDKGNGWVIQGFVGGGKEFG